MTPSKWWWDSRNKWFRYGSPNDYKQIHVAPYPRKTWFAMDHRTSKSELIYTEVSLEQICATIVDGNQLWEEYLKVKIKSI